MEKPITTREASLPSETLEQLESIDNLKTLLEFLAQKGFLVFYCANSVFQPGKADMLFIVTFNKSIKLAREGHYVISREDLLSLHPSLKKNILQNTKRSFAQVLEENISELGVSIFWTPQGIDYLKEGIRHKMSLLTEFLDLLRSIIGKPQKIARF